MITLIPAYEPDERLVSLVRAVRAARPDLPLVVVDDGSGPAHREVFDAAERAGAVVLTHPANLGKGRALRTGFDHVLRTYPGQGVVCADCDGQHTVDDILAVADRAEQTGADMVLGARQFTGQVPLRSRFGNTATRWAFRAATGVSVQDTQTGLRAYPATTLPWLLTIPGDRFEYELVALLRAAQEGMTLDELPIATVYLDENSSSHFRPVVDSARIYGPLLKFSASSLIAFAVDAAALLAFMALTGNLLGSVVAARAVSSTVNFLVNRHWVFRRRQRATLLHQAARYWVLVAVLGAAGYGSLWALTTIGVPLLAAKVATDAALFVLGFQVQRSSVFTGRRDSLSDAHSNLRRPTASSQARSA
ncbi:glycosyltransferase [Actinotalea sp.]|uniref:glycosyltransferase n=1 Tax=Actinotalea sp. TaxID=1872145 RepID=UPI00356ADB16